MYRTPDSPACLVAAGSKSAPASSLGTPQPRSTEKEDISCCRPSNQSRRRARAMRRAPSPVSVGLASSGETDRGAISSGARAIWRTRDWVKLLASQVALEWIRRQFGGLPVGELLL